MPVLPSYRNQSIDLQSKENQLNGLHMRATLAFNGLNKNYKYETQAGHNILDLSNFLVKV